LHAYCKQERGADYAGVALKYVATPFGKMAPMLGKFARCKGKTADLMPDLFENVPKDGKKGMSG
jgi:hypothetical protein